MTHSTSPVAWGVDGCKAGWFYFRLSAPDDYQYGVVKRLDEIIETASDRDLILVDIPIGLPTEGTRESDFRACDREARKALEERKSSVFPVPRREVADGLLSELKIGKTEGKKAWTWKNARRVLNQRKPPVRRGEGRMTAQSFAILSKIVEVDGLYRRLNKAKQIVRETHPEVCFWALNRKERMGFAKKHGLGFLDRLCLLEKRRKGARDAIVAACRDPKYRGVGSDDIVDAMACAVTASLALDKPQTLPAKIRDTIRLPFDPLHSEPMIVYAEPPSRSSA